MASSLLPSHAQRPGHMAPSDFLPTTFSPSARPRCSHTHAARHGARTRVLIFPRVLHPGLRFSATILTVTESGSHQQSGQLLVLCRQSPVLIVQSSAPQPCWILEGGSQGEARFPPLESHDGIPPSGPHRSAIFGSRERWHQPVLLSGPPAETASGTGPPFPQVPLALPLSLSAARHQPRAQPDWPLFRARQKRGLPWRSSFDRCATRPYSRHGMRRVSQSLPNTSLAPRTALTPFPTLRPMPHALCELHAGHQSQQPLAQQL